MPNIRHTHDSENCGHPVCVEHMQGYNDPDNKHWNSSTMNTTCADSYGHDFEEKKMGGRHDSRICSHPNCVDHARDYMNPGATSGHYMGTLLNPEVCPESGYHDLIPMVEKKDKVTHTAPEFYWHLHHGVLMEYADRPIEERIEYILMHKPRNEQVLRLKLLRRVQNVPYELVRVVDDMITLGNADYKIRDRVDIWMNDNADLINALHKVECAKDCPWKANVGSVCVGNIFDKPF